MPIVDLREALSPTSVEKAPPKMPKGIKRIDGARGVTYQVYSKASGVKRYVHSGTGRGFDRLDDAVKAREAYEVRWREKRAAGEKDEGDHATWPLRKACEAWLADKATDPNFGSLGEYGRRLRDYVYCVPEERPLGSMQIGKIDRKEIARWRKALAQRKAADHHRGPKDRTLSPATVNSAIDTLQSAFSWFADEEQLWIQHSPLVKPKRIEEPEEDPEWIQDKADVKRLLAHCTAAIQPIVALLVGTGMRINELLYLKWTDVDFSRHVISVKRGFDDAPTKGKRSRTVPLFKGIVENTLRRLHKERDPSYPYVIPSAFNPKRKEGTHNRKSPRSEESVRDGFKRALEAAGLAEIPLHNLRHTFASHFLLDGGDVYRVSKYLGHASVTITERVYAHIIRTDVERDLHRSAFEMPTEAAVYEYEHTDGKISGRKLKPAALTPARKRRPTVQPR